MGSSDSENSVVQVQATHVFILGLSLLICKVGAVSFCHGMTVVTGNCISENACGIQCCSPGLEDLGRLR